MALRSTEGPAVPTAIERFVKQLVVTHKAVQLYPFSSSIPHENALVVIELLHSILRDASDLRLGVSKEGLVFEGVPVFEGQPAYEAFTQEFYNRGLAEVRFHVGVREKDVAGFLGVLKSSAEEIEAAGGFESRLWDAGVDSITVKEASVKILDESQKPVAKTGDDEPWPPDSMRIDEILAAALGGRPRDERVLVRIIESPEVVTSYLRETLSARGGAPGGVTAATRFKELAAMVARQPAEVRAALASALADAVAGLDPGDRRQLLTEHLLPDARSNEALAAIVRQMDIDEVCELLVAGLADDDASAEGLARAVRYLAQVSMAQRDEVFNAAGAAMRGAGLAEETVNAVIDNVMPSQLTVRDRGDQSAERRALDSVLKIVEMAPRATGERFEDSPDFARLADEARAGLVDGDIVRAMVTLVTADPHGPQFSSMMALIEDSIDLLVRRGEYDVAADVAAELRLGATVEGLDPARVERVHSAIVRFAQPKDMRNVTKAMRMYERGTPEYDACRSLLTVLGSEAIDPLLEVLADEPDMAARKALVDLISDIAADFIDDLSRRVSDERWYVVRNVVAILGKTRRPEILSALGRTLRHSDARVRRETIRALSGVKDRLAEEMLIAALDDGDAQNVQLAARFLGSIGARGSAQAIAQVALGEGCGSREISARTEAIESLGKLGGPVAVATLEALAGKRSFLGSSRTRELRVAAEAALRAMSGGGAQ
ncbi:MAG: HEAT repeat domain-containing protein [Actinomycetota bacterium]|nr:HEAT repeat domain-containing protein [Actinomycetota bacterium]